MRVTLIKPNIGSMGRGPYIDEGRMEPLNIGVLAGLTPTDIDLKFYDDRMETIPYDEPTDIVAITVETFTARRAYEIAERYREHGVRVVLGGMHPMLLPEEAAKHADSVVIGDAESVWQTVLSDAMHGHLRKSYYGPPGVAQCDGSFPRRDIFNGKGYLPITLLQYTRGCRFACDFCAVSRYFDRRNHIRQIDQVVREIVEQDRRFLFFVDDNIATDHGALKELCAALRPLHVSWVSQASIDITSDPDLMKGLRDSGCLGNVIGFESISPESLREAKKGTNLERWTGFSDELKVIREYGLQTWAAFTVGYDHDTVASIDATLDFALRNRFAFAAFNVLMPYPGTDLYARLAAEDRLLYGGRWWLHPDYRFNYASFVPKRMMPDELTAACHRARAEFNSLPSIVRRATDKNNLRSVAHFVRLLGYMRLFRREVLKKHGMIFGKR
ncbi:MAG: B12-binding domain-containing radical SAM protein [Candidatus Moranbacteria bacterium]|nr:B12-binding domain-containing radical SAM protein [Candidatus Moranbacteria bacterium]